MGQFQPKIVECMKHYSKNQLVKDIFAGILVAVIAFPLSVALAISSGLSPEKGLYSAIIGGFFVSLFGGSKVNIGGITAATVMTVFTIVDEYGLAGLAAASIMAGVILILMGLFRLGGLLKYIPRTITLGFTAAIGVGIFTNQIKGFFGLQIETVPVKFLEKMPALFGAASTFQPAAVLVGAASIVILLVLPKINDKIPNSLAAILIMTPVVTIFKIPVSTIHSVYGDLPTHFPYPEIHVISPETLVDLLPLSVTLAILIAIVSLLACSVTDGLMGEKHNSNQELIAEGIANIFCGIFGAAPVAGAVARASNNVKNGGRTPIAGMVHSVVVTLILLFLMPLAGYIPMPVLSAVLIVVAVNMCNIKEFVYIGKHAPKSDFIVLMVTLFSGVLVDLLFAVEVGIILTAILLMKRMADVAEIQNYVYVGNSGNPDSDLDAPNPEDEIIRSLPEHTLVYRFLGPLFFAAADNFDIITTPDTLKYMILQMRSVPALDGAAMRHLNNLRKHCVEQGIALVLCGVQEQPMRAMKRYGLVKALGEDNICCNLVAAADRVKALDAKNSAAE